MGVRTISLCLAVWAMQMGLGSQASGQTSDWLHCRGPAYDGHAPTGGVHLPWPAQGPRVLWRKSVGEGYSGLVVSGRRVYSQIQTLGGQYLICLDLQTGVERWRTRYNWPWQADSEWPGPFGTPTLANGKVYFTDCFGFVRCADAARGHLVWSVNLAEQFGIEPPAFGYAITPLVHDGKVIVPVGEKGTRWWLCGRTTVQWFGKRETSLPIIAPVFWSAWLEYPRWLLTWRAVPADSTHSPGASCGGMLGASNTVRTAPGLCTQNPFCSMLCHFVVAVTP